MTTELSVKQDDLLAFLRGVLCGTQKSAGKKSTKVTKYYFNTFYIQPKDGKINVLAADSVLHRTMQRSSLSLISLEGNDNIPVKIVKDLLEVVDGLEGEINWKYENGILGVEDNDISLSIGLPAGGKEVDESLTGARGFGVADWNTANTWDETGVPKFTIEAGSALYNTFYCSLDVKKIDKFCKKLNRVIKEDKVKVIFYSDGIELQARNELTGRDLSTVLTTDDAVVNMQIPEKPLAVIGLGQILSNLPGDTLDIYVRRSSNGEFFIWLHSEAGKAEYDFCLEAEPLGSG